MDSQNKATRGKYAKNTLLVAVGLIMASMCFDLPRGVITNGSTVQRLGYDIGVTVACLAIPFLVSLLGRIFGYPFWRDFYYGSLFIGIPLMALARIAG